MTNTTTSPSPSVSVSSSPELALGPAQHGMWVTEQVLRPGSAHHLAVTARFAVPPDPAALDAGCARLLARHPVLASRLDPEAPALVPATGRAPELRRLRRARRTNSARSSRRRAPGPSTWPPVRSYGSRS